MKTENTKMKENINKNLTLTTCVFDRFDARVCVCVRVCILQASYRWNVCVLQTGPYGLIKLSSLKTTNESLCSTINITCIKQI